MGLKDRKCIPCKGGTPPLKGMELQRLLEQLDSGWQVVREHHLEKNYKFKNFKEALAFVNKVGAIAENEGHHPDIYLTWGHVKIEIFTHAIDGLTESDFILAAKLD